MDKRFSHMIGKQFMYASHTHLIKMITPMADDLFLIETDLSEYRMNKAQLANEWLPINNEVKRSDIKMPAINDNVLNVFNVESTQLNEVANILMDSIRKLQTDPDYIDQAKAIAESAKAVIDVKKTNIELLRVLKS